MNELLIGRILGISILILVAMYIMSDAYALALGYRSIFDFMLGKKKIGELK